MKIKPEYLQGHLERQFAPVYLVAGEEMLLVQEAADLIRKQAREKGFSEREVLEAGHRFDWNHLGLVAESRSLFAEQKIIELRIPTGKPGREGSQAIINYLKTFTEGNLLLVTCNKLDAASRKSKWVQAMDQAGGYVQIWPVKAHELPAWISQRMQILGLQLDENAVQLLAERLEGNLLAVNQELQKLQLLLGGGRVSGNEILDCVADSARFDVFRLIECIQMGRKGQALRIADGLRVTNAELPLMVGALVREIGQMRAVQTALANGVPAGAAFQQMKIWKARQGPIKAALRRLNRGDLPQSLSLLALMDRQSKGRAAGDVWQTLDEFICLLCGNTAGGAA